CRGLHKLLLWQSCLGFFFPSTAPIATYTLSLHDALPISWPPCGAPIPVRPSTRRPWPPTGWTRLSSPTSSASVSSWSGWPPGTRSEEHTSELQSRENLVCRLLLEKKKQT